MVEEFTEKDYDEMNEYRKPFKKYFKRSHMIDDVYKGVLHLLTDQDGKRDFTKDEVIRSVLII
jgi:hypothetical protein